MKTKIGFIGQGWIGKNLADNFEARGYETVRYAKEAPYDNNLDELKTTDIVFVAVPTPTTKEAFEDSILRGVIGLTKKGQIVVIKSTILPGTTDSLAQEYPDIFLFHSPEFLREASVKKDIEKPDRNIIGIPSLHKDATDWNTKAKEIIAVLPTASHNVICSAPEAELIKYGGNNFLYAKVVFMNMLYDMAMHHGARWDVIAETMSADPRIGTSHMQPVHQHTHMGEVSGRGAGGHCFIKDFAALRTHYEEVLSSDKETIVLLRALEAKNNSLLVATKKDLELLRGVYGEDILCLCTVLNKEQQCTCDVNNWTSQ